jgi:hypothetical protein
MYNLNRKSFILWICTSCFFEREGSRIKEDLIKGSEFIVTAQDLLDSVDNIPVHLLDEPAEGSHVRNDQCKLYYHE